MQAARASAQRTQQRRCTWLGVALNERATKRYTAGSTTSSARSNSIAAFMHALVVARRWQNAFLPGVLHARAGARRAPLAQNARCQEVE